MHRTLVTFFQCLGVILVIVVIANCQHCQKDEFCDSGQQQQQQQKQQIQPKLQLQQHHQKEIDEASSSTKVVEKEPNLNDIEKSSNVKNVILTTDSSPKCKMFDLTTFGKDNSSIFVIEAKGRIGNHLMAYTIIKALEAKLKIQVNQTMKK
jgi:hypothetical protein